MSTETAHEITITDEIADMAAEALRGYQIAESDLIDAGSEVLQAAGPALVALELRRLANTLAIVREEMRVEDDRTVRSSGLGEGIRRMRARADELERSTR